MKNKILIISAIVLIIGIIGGYIIASFSKNSSTSSTNLNQNQKELGQKQNLNKITAC